MSRLLPVPLGKRPPDGSGDILETRRAAQTPYVNTRRSPASLVEVGLIKLANLETYKTGFCRGWAEGFAAAKEMYGNRKAP